MFFYYVNKKIVTIIRLLNFKLNVTYNMKYPHITETVYNYTI